MLAGTFLNKIPTPPDFSALEHLLFQLATRCSSFSLFCWALSEVAKSGEDAQGDDRLHYCVTESQCDAHVLPWTACRTTRTGFIGNRNCIDDPAFFPLSAGQTVIYRLSLSQHHCPSGLASVKQMVLCVFENQRRVTFLYFNLEKKNVIWITNLVQPTIKSISRWNKMHIFSWSKNLSQIHFSFISYKSILFIWSINNLKCLKKLYTPKKTLIYTLFNGVGCI